MLRGMDAPAGGQGNGCEACQLTAGSACVVQVGAYNRQAAAAYHKEQGDPVMAIDSISQLVYETLDKADKPQRAKYRSKQC